MRLLIIDDDQALSRFLRRELKIQQYTADNAYDGEAALDLLRRESYDLMILDLNLPGMDGLDLLQQTRAIDPNLPVLVLTARSRKEDLVQALERGADDCLVKPFSFQELQARIRSLLRRKSVAAGPVGVSGVSGVVPKLSNLVIHTDERRVTRGDRKIDLTPREFALLEHLMKNAGKPVSRMTLMREVWNAPFDPSTNVVDVYMKYLRDKIDRDEERKLIRTVRGVGYVFGEE
ncbi:DNA-binding response regulator, OmpR family, contains REC and winged-helix (wHTH) domain [Bryocella elongata]|uniref:DNA-binding response regulator, OmpR family, contains REC and winged-helix (WHTH) domain n=1 Tax=Bryocella elongata TaxID=863522 RepID=A0A1H5TJL7_9BACT|nr:response regulator transcription factor [Bryocella elongata]SEF62281.1 DNA-binding response regulator, OmpR family, contains REC and winged-helix (wHTH) domain [Bryocella elongata]